MKTQVNGITIAYDDRGTGFPIVFLHAFPFNRTMWLQQETALCQCYRTISIDLRGHGESDAPFWRYSLEQYAQDVKEVLAGLGIAGAVFVGLSMGGYLEFALHRLYPELIRGLVFADTKAEADKPEQIRWRFDLAQRTAAMGSAAVIAELLPKLLAPNTYERDRISLSESDPFRLRRRCRESLAISSRWRKDQIRPVCSRQSTFRRW